MKRFVPTLSIMAAAALMHCAVSPALAGERADGPASVPVPGYAAGLQYRYYEGDWEALPEVIIDMWNKH